MRKSTTIEHIPFLSVSRSLGEDECHSLNNIPAIWFFPSDTFVACTLTRPNISLLPLSLSLSLPFLSGDLWSYDYAKDDYYVCPEPDVHVLQINPHVHKVLILASDGLWNMLRPQDAVGCVQDVEREMEKRWFKTKVSLVQYGTLRGRKKSLFMAWNIRSWRQMFKVFECSTGKRHEHARGDVTRTTLTCHLNVSRLLSRSIGNGITVSRSWESRIIFFNRAGDLSAKARLETQGSFGWRIQSSE